MLITIYNEKAEAQSGKRDKFTTSIVSVPGVPGKDYGD